MVDPRIKADRLEAIHLAGFLRGLSATGRHVFDDGERETLRKAAGFLARFVDLPDLDPATDRNPPQPQPGKSSQSSRSSSESNPSSPSS